MNKISSASMDTAISRIKKEISKNKFAPLFFYIGDYTNLEEDIEYHIAEHFNANYEKIGGYLIAIRLF